MVQLRILSGKQAGATWVARRFPVRIGREAGAHLRLDDAGVWDRHLVLEFQPEEGVVLSTQAGALASVNHQPVSRAVLRNGDTIDLGGARLQFWLSDTTQRGLRFREWLTWAGIAAVTLTQVALIYWLIYAP